MYKIHHLDICLKKKFFFLNFFFTLNLTVLFHFLIKQSYTRVAKALQGQGEAGNAVKCLEEGLQHVEDVQGKKEMMKLIDEYKRDPSCK